MSDPFDPPVAAPIAVILTPVDSNARAGLQAAFAGFRMSEESA